MNTNISKSTLKKVQFEGNLYVGSSSIELIRFAEFSSNGDRDIVYQVIVSTPWNTDTFSYGTLRNADEFFTGLVKDMLS